MRKSTVSNAFFLSRFRFRVCAVEARKQFKTFVNILSTMKNEDSEKLLVLRKKYLNKCPADTSMNMSGQSAGNLSAMEAAAGIVVNAVGMSVVDSNRSAPSTPLKPYAPGVDVMASSSPYLTPPPYKPPPPAPQQQQSTPTAPVPGIVSSNTQEQYRECVDEFKWALNAFSGAKTDDSVATAAGPADVPGLPAVPAQASDGAVVVGVERKLSASDSGANGASEMLENRDKENAVPDEQSANGRPATLEKQISVREATKKFNQIASEEEVKLVTSPPAKKPMHMQQQSEKVCYSLI